MRKYLLSVLFLVILSSQALALEPFKIDFAQSRIDGSIHYSVVGKYRSVFEDFQGDIYVDLNEKRIKGVDLVIKTGSIKSSFENLDNIVKSQQLLDAKRYPNVIFQSFDIQPNEEGKYLAVGHLDLHGVVQRIESPFIVEGPLADEEGRLMVRVKGKWVIYRKDFNIIWNKFLDKGGILVGNHITVDWEIIAYQR